jgi:class 3 adenylate cyclase/putative methionine-R-sulfoxide reductase with GAF domain
MTDVASDKRIVDLTREVETLREQRRAISGVLRAVARFAGLQPVLDEVVEACRRLCDADHGALWLLQDGLLHSAAHQGGADAAQYDREHPHVLDRTTAAGRTAVTRQPVHIPDVESDPEYSYPGPRPYRAMLGVPVVVEEDLIGVVVVVRREPGPFTDDHIALLQTFADQAAIAITNARLLEAVERQRTELSRFVSPHVAALISSDDGKQVLAGHRAYITVVYFDLRGFTTFAETAEPEELIDVLAEYHAAAGELVTAYEGTLEHFAGDGMMVFFNDPVPLPQPELQAAKLALAMRERIGECAARWRKRGYELALGGGIAVGHATLGRIGFEGRYDYGALGIVTSLAARLSDEAAGEQILLSQRAYAALEGRVEARPIARLQLKGFARPIEAYELLSLRG